MKVYDSQYTNGTRILDNLRYNKIDLSRLSIPEGPVLDWGCGNGAATRRLPELFPGVDIVGIDCDEYVIGVADNSNDNVKVSFSHCDGFDLDEIRKEPYAAIFAMNSLTSGLRDQRINDEQFKYAVEVMINNLARQGVLFLGHDPELWVYQKHRGLVKRPEQFTRDLSGLIQEVEQELSRKAIRGGFRISASEPNSVSV